METLSYPFPKAVFRFREIDVADTYCLKSKLMSPRAYLRCKCSAIELLRIRVLHSQDDSRINLNLPDEHATISLAHRLAAQLKPGMVIYLHGNLGAGKTTLVRGVLEALGYPGRVKSPTYTLVEPYHIAGLDLRHFDLYRMHDAHEWDSAGFRDEFDGHNIFFIEWPEKAQNQIPQADVEIVLDILHRGRNAKIHANTEIGKQCTANL